MTKRRLLVVGSTASYALETSYASAARELGHDVRQFDVDGNAAKHIPFGRAGALLHRYLPVRSWTHKLNRELALVAREFSPDVILYFTSAPIWYGTLATIRTMLPGTRIAWIWPDTPLNLTEHNLAAARLVDLTATYSRSTVPSFEKLGFHNVKWIPLAGDPHLHGGDSRDPEPGACDVSFVGGWRPERERTMAALADAFPGRRLEVHGPVWREKCQDRRVRALIKSDGLLGSALGEHFRRSRININRIDDTNYPAANMRFFEIPIAGGLQLSSACPEMEDEFKDRQHVVYFRDDSELVERARWLLDDSTAARDIRKAGHALAAARHTYVKRLETLLGAVAR